ncbi:MULTISPECIES: pyridoxal-dependent decarboxylase, exosortase A system-associated [unclassified Sphingomonas]|uniref:pyridoxal-dependent decarboxylase, exosortase A system-associated n=1 Tax=unclassified Sphingomonas TaxID=196159 RepID=UPI002151F69F|nr:MULTISPECIES: pyridoxal-dependent decarboxylase, exosortase A system-associated [unclassified Sphingomonas]MCR5871963.1 pyridoxal-dependent decarboxylase, exosortase A system-associated [Sphingomonas sp. J344]UUX99759.1 pyridoxal-dependent decarboxylase, exosortase A system-associated [Sphingomonas sp. J315]
MKPMGPIPPYFAGQSGELRIAGRSAGDWVAQAGTPLFVYDASIVRERVGQLRAALPGAVEIHFAIKANPLPAFLQAVSPLVGGLDVASGGELAKALAVKDASHISFAGPGKRDAELEAAIVAGATLNLESEGEADRALAIGDRLGVTPKLAVRVNPSFELKGSGMKMGGRPSPFGIDADRVPTLVKRLIAAGADWRGFHIFAGSQALDSDAICETQAATAGLARELAEAAGAKAPLVNLGGGFGIPYFSGDTAVDIALVGERLADVLEPDQAYAIELGRWIAGECGVYLTRIVDRKVSGDEIFLICDGGLNHQLAASGNFGTVVRRNYPIAIAGRMGAETTETVSVVGPLCTPLDRLGDKVALPPAQVGDVVALFLAGAYGASASPSGFLGHGPAAEIVA